ncbi:MAG TPA: hypothetical protein P5032_18995 [Candidatus Competibacter sp.]|nr:hypothetical protein [Candidatus Competibacter sp.]
MNPAEKSLGGAIQPTADTAELSEEIVAAFHRWTNLADARSALTPRRGLQAKAGGVGARPAGVVAVGAVGLSRGQAADIKSASKGRARAGGDTTHAAGSASVWQPSRALAEVTTAPKGMARPSHASCKAVPHWARSTGKARFVRPFFSRLLGAVEQDLIPVVDPSS